MQVTSPFLFIWKCDIICTYLNVNAKMKVKRRD